MKDVRERATQILVQNIGIPVSMTVTVGRRTNKIAAANEFDKVNSVL